MKGKLVLHCSVLVPSFSLHCDHNKHLIYIVLVFDSKIFNSLLIGIGGLACCSVVTCWCFLSFNDLYYHLLQIIDLSHGYTVAL